MKRVIAILTITAFFTACGGGNNSNVNTGDSVKRAADSIKQTGDTSAMNQVMGDTTSASGIHGAGSGSEVGGGKSGGPQEKGDSAK
ncbi:MAG: hypothetical protein JWQ09_337 [Segetibacter sp.]|nr:hypothetical protein [Segetibacter sp.]